MDWLVNMPTWQIIRVLGVTAYLLVASGMAVGILYSYRFWTKPQKLSVYRWHYRLTIGGTVAGLLHGAFLYIDHYVSYSWVGIVVPFMAKEHPILSGLGTISAYGLLLLILSTDLRAKLKKKLWLALHMLSYPIFVISLIHGFFLGTDSELGAIKFMYMSTAVLIVGLTLIRAVYPGKKAQSVRLS